MIFSETVPESLALQGARPSQPPALCLFWQVFFQRALAALQFLGGSARDQDKMTYMHACMHMSIYVYIYINIDNIHAYLDLHTHCIWPFAVFRCVFWYGYGTHGQALLPQAAFVSRCISLVKNNKFPHLVVFKTGCIPFWLVHKNLSEGNMDVEPLDIPRSTDLWGFFELPSPVIWYELNACPCVLVSFNDRSRGCHGQPKFGRQRTWKVWLFGIEQIWLLISEEIQRTSAQE